MSRVLLAGHEASEQIGHPTLLQSLFRLLCAELVLIQWRVIVQEMQPENFFLQDSMILPVKTGLFKR